MRRTRSAFTLIELLVVISIISLLLSILLPGLAKARVAAKKTASLNNLRQINIGARQYQDDNRGYMPITPAYPGRTANADPNSFPGWCTWSFGGKNCDGQRWGNTQFDIEAADRPLNPYVYPDMVWDPPSPTTPLAPNDPARKIQEAPVFRDPSDKFTNQGPQWPAEGKISSYDDVGTSYHWSYWWYYNPPPGVPVGVQSWRYGLRQMAIGDTFQSSRYVWVYDETADIIVNDDPRIPENVINGYGEINRAVAGFLDGHAAYIKFKRRSLTGPDYTLLFMTQRR
jgi:prepilin-type N-terminal cleavage/methylation domain-containing protein